MVDGLFLFVRGKISERFRNSGNFEFKVTNLQLLSELRDKLARCITVNISIKELTEDFITKVNEIINQNAEVQPRNCALQFKVYDSEENIAVLLPAKKIKVNPNNELLKLLETHKLDFKLN